MRRLAAPVGLLSGVSPAANLVDRAAQLFGDSLVGVLAFGSWARGEATPGSDIDVLIVLESRCAITRELYRAWDAKPLAWEGHEIEPHMVHLPEHGTVGTVWAEASVDGVVLFERDLRVSRNLSAVRRAIAAGRLVRRMVHGQPYWAEVA